MDLNLEQFDEILTLFEVILASGQPADTSTTTEESTFGEDMITSLRAWAVQVITEAGKEGAIGEAQAAGAVGTVWVAEADACVDCAALSGETSTVVPAFDPTITWGDSPNTWADFDGGPPRHPNCRCRIDPWLGDPGFPEALQRESERAVLEGWSLPSESTPLRLRAVSRLLSRGGGTRVPKTVERYARQALHDGKFARGRVPPA